MVNAILSKAKRNLKFTKLNCVIVSGCYFVVMVNMLYECAFINHSNLTKRTVCLCFQNDEFGFATLTLNLFVALVSRCRRFF